MRIVDAHLHLQIDPAGRACDPKLLMESGVVDQAWLLSANGYTRDHATDEENLALARQYPDYFVPFGYLDFNQSPDRIETLYRKGCVGLKAIWGEEPYDARRYFPYYDAAQALHIPILFHVGGAYYEAPCRPRTPDSCVIPLEQTFGRNMLPIHIDAVAKCFPQLTIIMAHLGGDIPYFEQAALICRGHSRMRGRAPMYMDLSSELTYYSVAALAKVKEVIEDVGPQNILYGSDTFWGNAPEVARFWRFFLTKTLRLRGEDVERIMGGNADEIVAEAKKHRPEGAAG